MNTTEKNNTQEQSFHSKVQTIRAMQGKKSTFQYKDETITIEWSVQWDDRLNSFFIFAFPTPVLGILIEDQTINIFPVSGNKTIQKKAKEMLNEIFQKGSKGITYD